MIKTNLKNVFNILKESNKEKKLKNLFVNGSVFTIENLESLHILLTKDNELINCIEIDFLYYLSRRKALIVLLEEDYWDKISYNFTNLSKHEYLASQRFEITNNEKRDLDTPQKVHPKNPCKYFNENGMGYKKREYKKALNEILDTPFYFFEVEKAIETLRATRKKMRDKDC